MLCVFLTGIKLAQSQTTTSKYYISSSEVNSEMSEYASVYYDNSILYISDKKDITLFSAEDETTGHSFHDVFTNSTDSKVKLLLTSINSPFHEGPLCFSKDKNLVFFTRSAYYQKKKRYNSGDKMNLQIFYITFENGTWGEIKEFPINSTEYSIGHPCLSKDEKYLYFASDMPSGKGGTDIYRIAFNNSTWGKPENLGNEINTASNELFPFVSDLNVLYFSSDAEGGYGGLDIFKSVLKNGNYSFRERLESSINSESDDFSFSIYATESGEESGMLSSNRAGGKGSDDVYQWSSNVKPLKIRGIVTDTKGNIVKDALIVYTDANGKSVSIRTDVMGKYKFEAERKSFYNLSISHKDYFNNDYDVSSDAEEMTEFIDFNIVMDDFPVFVIKPIDEAGNVITGMKVGINCDGEAVYTGVSNGDGIFWEFPRTYRRGDSVNLIVDFNKKGYLNKKITIKMVIENGGEIVIPKENFLCVKAEEKLEISKIIDLQPIYYDLAKWDIRADAAIELDKVIEFLNSNPNLVIELSSHTDCRGTDNSNLQLSDKRAKSAADYIKTGINDKNQIYGKGYGEAKPINQCPNCNCSEEEHAKNRRTEFTIVKVGE